MTSDQFTALMPIFSADLVKTYAALHDLPEDKALGIVYNSELYAMLEDESTKLWHYSSPMLCTLLDEELSTGSITFPDV